jgi:hypothetical protein
MKSMFVHGGNLLRQRVGTSALGLRKNVQDSSGLSGGETGIAAPRQNSLASSSMRASRV